MAKKKEFVKYVRVSSHRPIKDWEIEGAIKHHIVGVSTVEVFKQEVKK